MTTHSNGTTADTRYDSANDLGPMTADPTPQAPVRRGPGASTSLGLLLLRLVVGVVFIAHGVQKVWINGIPATQEGFAGMGVPMPEVAAIVVAALEIGGGALLILGLGTRIVGALLTVNMAVALVLVHIAGGFFASDGGYEFVLTLGVASLALAFTGPGLFAIDAAFRRRRS
ncbi:putative oxidoreductase [Labedella gwakjiensis]|nr:DoxX family protein [Labedella gwakjiensis]PSL37815.1 putative oxidoreductase [Labedella gwakjiensis]